MKYGLIKDGKCICYGNDDLGKWQGRIEYNENHERLTATEMIAKCNLKEIVVTTDFNGNWQDYNFVEQDGVIIVTNITKSKTIELQCEALENQVLESKKFLNKTDYILLRYLAVNAGLRQYKDEDEKLTTLEVVNQRFEATDKINELESMIKEVTNDSETT